MAQDVQGGLIFADPQGVLEVVSPDGSVTIVDPTGPVVGLSVSGGSGVAGGECCVDYSVNAAKAYVTCVPDFDSGVRALVLRAGSRTNAAGAYNGGGSGNKAIAGFCRTVAADDMDPLDFDGLFGSDLTGFAYEWKNMLGPVGPKYTPPEPVTTLTPYFNLLVDFGGGDLRIVVLLSDQLAPAVSSAIGAWTWTGDTVRGEWGSLYGGPEGVLLVNAPPNPVPGGVAPIVDVGPTWLDKAYSWTALMEANPTAKLRASFPGNTAYFPSGDGGMPVGAWLPPVLLVSGDSGNVTKSGKLIVDGRVNGGPLWML
jgi:hypothetical protein